MRRPARSPEWAVQRAEAQARAHLNRERAINRVIERRNPGLASTARYQRGPLPPWHPRFGSLADYLEYRARREMGRFDPNVDYPDARSARRTRTVEGRRAEGVPRGFHE